MLIVFFFQAEDGIRDVAVTGVQTCALPISNRLTPANQATLSEARVLLVPSQWASTPPPANTLVSPRRTSTCCACRPTESMIILQGRPAAVSAGDAGGGTRGTRSAGATIGSGGGNC